MMNFLNIINVKNSKYGAPASLDNIAEKINLKNFKNKRMYKPVSNIIDEKRGKRFHKYSEAIRKKIDYKYKTVPISYNDSGIDTEVSTVDYHPYCYNKNGVCSFWRYDRGIIYCDAYKDVMEIDNSGIAYVSAYIQFKSEKNMDKFKQPIALFDMVNCCSFSKENY